MHNIYIPFKHKYAQQSNFDQISFLKLLILIIELSLNINKYFIIHHTFVAMTVYYDGHILQYWLTNTRYGSSSKCLLSHPHKLPDATSAARCALLIEARARVRSLEPMESLDKGASAEEQGPGYDHVGLRQGAVFKALSESSANHFGRFLSALKVTA